MLISEKSGDLEKLWKISAEKTNNKNYQNIEISSIGVISY